MSTRITVNGVTYDDVEAMPADVRRQYEQALARFRALSQGGVASSSDPTVKKNEIHVSFQLTSGGHGLGFGKGSGPPSQPIEGPLPGVFHSPTPGPSTPSPLFSDSAESRFRLIAHFLSACLTGGFLFWLLVGDR
jgi:hypothetical protein